MAATTREPDLRKLTWESQCGWKVANDGRRLCIRESIGSIVGGFIFAVVISASAVWLGVSIMLKPYTIAEKAFGVFMFVIAGLFLWLLVSTLRRGRWMLVYDRGEPGVPGEIRQRGKVIPITKVRGFSTRSIGGNPPRSTVIVELHDGTIETLGPIGMLTWPAHFARQAADWMGLPFRPGS